MKNLVLFASGSGSNVENIITYFRENKEVQIRLVLTNNPRAGVLDRCARLGVPALYFNRKAFYDSDVVLGILRNIAPDLVVLAGFLWKVPQNLTSEYSGRLINIHPALLPKYGGKGMYGMHVHQAVVDSGDTESGITIHYVNENYDDGAIILQAKTRLSPTDTPEMVAEKVHKLEYEHFPRVIEKLLAQG